MLFRSYAQDDNSYNGKEHISWSVLDRGDRQMLIVSEYAVDCHTYSNQYAKLIWADCTLRFWLSNSFLGAAFSANEQQLINLTNVSTEKT